MSIGEGLYDIFYCPEFIRKHWDGIKVTTWFRNRDAIEVFWKWLLDESATSRLGKRDKQWIQDTKNRKGRDRHLFRRLAELIASIWLQSQKSHPNYAFEWISEYLMLVRVVYILMETCPADMD